MPTAVGILTDAWSSFDHFGKGCIRTLRHVLNLGGVDGVNSYAQTWINRRLSDIGGRAVTTTGGIKIGAEPVGALAVGVVIVPLVGLIGANVELVAPSLTVCVWPHASETENSNNPVKTKTETRLPQKQIADGILPGYESD
jgi:hypothetical protein